MILKRNWCAKMYERAMTLKEEDDTEFIVFWHKSKKKMGIKDGLAMPQHQQQVKLIIHGC